MVLEEDPMRKTLVAVVVAARRCFPILLLVAAASGHAADPRSTVPVGDSPVLGPGNAPVTLIEFIDYQ